MKNPYSLASLVCSWTLLLACSALLVQSRFNFVGKNRFSIWTWLQLSYEPRSSRQETTSNQSLICLWNFLTNLPPVQSLMYLQKSCMHYSWVPSSHKERCAILDLQAEFPGLPTCVLPSHLTPFKNFCWICIYNEPLPFSLLYHILTQCSFF